MHTLWVIGAGFVALALTGCDGGSYASAEGRTYQALMKLDSALGAGVAHDQYNALLGEARAAAEPFFDRNLAGVDAELAEALRTSLRAFTTANEVIRIQTKADQQIVFSGNVYYDELIRTYPPAAKLAKEVAGTGTSEIHFPWVLKQVFDEAHAALADAALIVQRQQTAGYL